MKFEEKMVQLRKRQGLSQEALADRIGVSRQAVSRWELGATMPDAPNLVKLADLFGVTTDYLLREDQTEAHYISTPPERVPENPLPEKGKTPGRFLFSGCCYLFAAFCFFIAAAIRADNFSFLYIAAGALQLGAGCGMLWKYRMENFIRNCVPRK